MINVYCSNSFWVAPVNTDFGAPLLKIKNLGGDCHSNRPAISRWTSPPPSTPTQMLAKLPLDNAHSHQTNNHVIIYWKTKITVISRNEHVSYTFFYTFLLIFFSQLLKHESANEKKKSAPPPVWKLWTLRQNRHKLDIAPLLRWINNGRLWLAI